MSDDFQEIEEVRAPGDFQQPKGDDPDAQVEVVGDPLQVRRQRQRQGGGVEVGRRRPRRGVRPGRETSAQHLRGLASDVGQHVPRLDLVGAASDDRCDVSGGIHGAGGGHDPADR